jgi:hypothetical protein
VEFLLTDTEAVATMRAVSPGPSPPLAPTCTSILFLNSGGCAGVHDVWCGGEREGKWTQSTGTREDGLREHGAVRYANGPSLACPVSNRA